MSSDPLQVNKDKASFGLPKLQSRDAVFAQTNSIHMKPADIRSLTRVRKRCSAIGKSAIVATAFPEATRAGLWALQAGGNAVDAAVAAAWALSVCEPGGSGLGGQTTMLIHFPDGHQLVLDGHSYAPAAVSTKIVKRSQQRRGYRACTIPSTPATLGAASKNYGQLPLSDVISPAIKLAEEGFKVTKLFRRQIQWCRIHLRTNEAAFKLLFSEGKVVKKGTIFRQPELGRTLKRIAQNGTEDFYIGEIARDIVDDMKQNGGLLNEDDLATLQLPVDREAISSSYRGYRIVSIPLPGGGLQVLQALKVFEQFDLSNGDIHDWYKTIAKVVDIVYRERNRWPLYMEKMTSSMVGWFVGKARAAELAEMVRRDKSCPVSNDAEEPGDTTHLCVADKDGMVVSLTQSIQSLYGAKVANGRLGFFYNNYLSTCPRRPHPSLLSSNALPRSNAAPTIVLRDVDGASDRPVLALGAAGSRRITSALLQIITNYIDLSMSLPEAVDAPRIHATLSGKAYIERRIASEEMIRRLSDCFRQVEVKASRSYAMGGAQAIALDPSGHWVGTADPRREGTADGY